MFNPELTLVVVAAVYGATREAAEGGGSRRPRQALRARRAWLPWR